MNDIRGMAATHLGVKQAMVTVAPLDGSAVPGVQLHRASAGTNKDTVVAVLSSGAIVVGGEAVRQKIFQAWAPGKPPVETVAAVITCTLELGEPASVLTDPGDITYLARLGVVGVAPPHEETRGADPAFVWWVGTGANPATEVILQLTSGVPKLSYGRTHGGG